MPVITCHDCWRQKIPCSGAVYYIYYQLDVRWLLVVFSPYFMVDYSDIITWKHFPHWWPFVMWIHWSLVEPLKAPVMWSFYVFFVVSMNELWNKQSSCQRFEISYRSHDVTVLCMCMHQGVCARMILGLCPANERRRYFVMTSLIGWVQA